MSARRGWPLLVLVLLMLPVTAGAFSSREEPLRLAYGRDGLPIVFATGAVGLDGEARGGFMASGVREVVLRDVPTLVVTDRDESGRPRNTTFQGADLVVHQGTLVWTFGDGGGLDLDVAAPYGMGLALPRLPVPTGASDGPGALLVGPTVDGSLSWNGARASLVLLSAEASILDASGSPVAGWDRRAVNPGAAQSGADPSTLSLLLTATGRFQGAAHARILGAAMGGAEDVAMSVSPADEDLFAETLDALEELGELAPDPRGDDVLGQGNPLRQLQPFSGVLNGALVISGGAGGDASLEVLESTFGGEPYDVGALALVRGPMTVRWDEAAMRVEGTPAVALSRQGFTAEEPATVGLFPLVAVVLWAVAAAAIVVYFVKRPPKPDARFFGMRAVSFLVHVVALALAFWWWDHSFAQTFGTSFLTLLQDGSGLQDWGRLGTVFAIETLPWGLAVLCFALPVRIALGVALRYLGKGTAFKGVAKAGGFVALGLLGPLYALWLLNTVVGLVLPALGSAFSV